MSKEKNQSKYLFTESYDGKSLEKQSFARFTVENRFPKIFSEHCSGDYEKDFLRKKLWEALSIGSLDSKDSCELFTESGLDKFLYAVNEKIRRPYHDYSVPKKKKLHKSNDDRLNKSSALEEFFDNAPFFESEILFYHVLLAQKKYFSNQYDFFATEKKDSLENSREKFIENLNALFSSGTQKELDKQIFRKNIRYCLSANTSDLSQLNAKERFDYRVEDIRILHDDTDILFAYISEKKHFKCFDIICDNAGKELFSDLYLACYLLFNNIVEKVVFHLKPYPFFVSDATKEDFGFMMNAITQYGGIESARQCKEYIRKGNIEIDDDAFWASHYCFKDMPHGKLRSRMRKSDLIIVKGDLNYRRLVEDRDWSYTDSFAKRTRDVFGNAPIFAPRVLKSDVLVGISEAAYQTAKSNDKHGAPADQRFKGNGKWAVVHFRCHHYKRYKRLSECEEQSQAEKKKSYNDSKNTEVKLSAKNAPEQQDAKKSTNKKKNGFYITINVCYILAIVLILAMLVFSTIPVITQTVAVAHKNSDPTKTQESEHLQETQKNQSALILINNDSSEQSETEQKVKTAELKYGDVAGRIDFTLLLTGYAIFLTGTLIIPKVLLKKEVEEGVEKYAENTVKKMVNEHFQERIKGTQNELHRTDAHLSRMIAFQLHKEYPVWSVGWAYRSLKRYKNLDSKKIGFIEYRDFIRFLEDGVIASSIKKFHDEVEKKFQTEHPYEPYRRNMFPLTSAQHVLEEEALKAKEENLRPALRAIKDISDFEYAVRFDKSNEIGETEIGILQHIATCAGLFARELCAVILWNYSKAKSNSNLHGNTYDSETMMQELLKISNYGEKSNVEQKVRQKFQQILKQTLLQIESARKSKPYDYYDTKDIIDSEYFFADESASALVIKE